MSTINSLKKEVELLHKALNIKGDIPEWKKQSDELIEMLKASRRINARSNVGYFQNAT